MARAGKLKKARDEAVNTAPEIAPDAENGTDEKKRPKSKAAFGLGEAVKNSSFTVGNLAKAAAFLLICFLMISPLRSCVLTDGDYIGALAAQEIAVGDAGMATEKARNLQTDMVKVDDEYCYKVQFTGTVTDYRYLIDAETGEIIASAFYHLDGE